MEPGSELSKKTGLGVMKEGLWSAKAPLGKQCLKNMFWFVFTQRHRVVRVDGTIFLQVTAIAPKIATSPKDWLSCPYPSSLEDSILPAVWRVVSSQLLPVSFFKMSQLLSPLIHGHTLFHEHPIQNHISSRIQSPDHYGPTQDTYEWPF